MVKAADKVEALILMGSTTDVFSSNLFFVKTNSNFSLNVNPSLRN